ncbi:MAG: AAA family ATPase, partial [Lachnospiraceae bacterium]|nr:AAA family ATPase [Lachnospiraceae bacterium]
MLISLHVKNLALIEETEVFFSEGLNILTGETGAGKSIIIGSINLALGAKADKDMVRSGAEYALIELVFVIERPEQLAEIRAMELPVEDDGTLVLSRKITGGRGALRINGETIGAAQLRDLAGILLDIHGQHEHQALLKAANHREILDGFGREALAPLKSGLKQAYHEYQALTREIEKESQDEAARQRELELLEFEIREIEEARLVAGEDEQAEKEFQRLNNADKIREALTSAHSFCGYESEGGAGAGVSRAVKEILAAARLDEELDSLAKQLNDIDNLLGDFNRQLSASLESLEFDKERFIACESRLNLLNHLKGKYRAGLTEILAQCAEKKERAAALKDYENYQRGLLKKQEGLRGQVLEYCRQISAIRGKLGQDLQEKMVAALRDLNFPHIR